MMRRRNSPRARHIPWLGAAVALLALHGCAQTPSSGRALITTDGAVTDTSDPSDARDGAGITVVVGYDGRDGGVIIPIDVPPDTRPARCASNADCVGNPAGTACDVATGACIPACGSNVDCRGNAAGEVCNPATGLCGTTCRTHADCVGAAAGDVCDTSTHTCAPQCNGDIDCVNHPAGAVCDPTLRHCVACSPARDTCPADQHCDPASHVCASGCRADEGCGRATLPDGTPGAQLWCDTSTRTCQECVNDSHCATGQRCSGGVCVQGCLDDTRCGAGQLCCAGACVDIEANTANCGACGNTCGGANAAPACAAGRCGIARCIAPYEDCDGELANGCETNTNVLVNHCGACGNVCPAREHASPVCAAGTCTFQCENGWADCNGDPSDGCETSTETNVLNCGVCGRACALGNANSACRDAICQIDACRPGYADCDGIVANGCEVDTRRDTGACGACGNICPTPPHGSASCVAGACGVTACDEGWADCNGDPADGCEADLRAGATSCGACGSVCSFDHAVPGCASGSCVVAACHQGWADCDMNPTNGCESELARSVAHCGGCGQACVVANGTPTCEAGTCAVASCNAGFADCNGDPSDGCEVDLRSDVSSCGACGRGCALPGGANACVAGACVVSACSAGLGDCDGVTSNGCETSVATSVSHCGACGRACPGVAGGTSACVAGACAIAACSAGLADCDGTVANGCETNLGTSATNCGACGRACPARPNTAGACSAGACTYACLAGFRDCDGDASNGCEVNTLADTSNCGACGTRCTAATGGAATCTAGGCVSTCPASTTLCGGVCRALGSDVNNCGACGRTCTIANGTAGCVAGACTVGTCNAGFADCDGNAANGCETSTLTNASNCGTCGRVCTASSGGTPTCVAGVCAAGCATGTTSCGGACVSLLDDEANCGACGRACGTSQACSNGVCVGQGTLRFTLTWDRAGDMDLHIRPPCGTEIYYGNTSACGGTLDVDDTSRTGPENIFWSGAAASGRYYVCPESYTSDVANANYTLVVVRDGVEIRRVTGTRGGRTDGNTACGAGFPGVITLDL